MNALNDKIGLLKLIKKNIPYIRQTVFSLHVYQSGQDPANEKFVRVNEIKDLNFFSDVSLQYFCLIG